MADRPWKVAERRIAARLGGRRTVRHPGGPDAGDLGDVVGVPGVFVDVKLRQSHGASRWWREAAAKVKGDAIPCLVLREAGSPRSLVVVDLEQLHALAAKLPAGGAA